VVEHSRIAATALNAAHTWNAVAAVQELVEHLHRYLSKALPLLPSERLVDLLEFIAIQNASKVFGETDNTSRRQEIAMCCQMRPFVLSEGGIKSLVDLVRFAEATCTVEGNPFSSPLGSLENQMWTLVEGALNTVAAIVSFERDAIACFEAVDSPGSVRCKYLRRGYARDAMHHKSVKRLVTRELRFGSDQHLRLAVGCVVFILSVFVVLDVRR
jgi:hypothetical protein